MSTDFSKYQNIIDNFRGEVSKPSFDIRFTQITTQLAKTEKFLLKMELKRLASACTRSIDLRGLVDGECKLFEYGGQSHFLDEIAIRVFEESVKLYKGYTFGVYEAVKNTENNFRVLYQKEKQSKEFSKLNADSLEQQKKSADKIQYPVSTFPLNQYHERIEERMNFVIPLAVISEDNQKKSVSSIDISTTGVKFRFNSKAFFNIDQKLIVTFNGLETDFPFTENNPLTYQVKNIYHDNNTQLVGCQSINRSESDDFERFLQRFIQINKRRYKVNLENTISALQSRSLEQYVLPKINELPIFFEQVDSNIIPRYVLTTANNQGVLQYWQDEDNRSNLHSLVNEERLERLVNRHKQGKPLLVYSFVHQNQGKDYFYTIDEDQLSQEYEFSPTFFTFASKRNSFAVTKLTYFSIDKSKIYSPFVLSNSQDLNKQQVNLPPSDEVVDCIDSLSFSVVASDITHKTAIEQYQHFSDNEIDVHKLKKFGHKRLKDKLTVTELNITYKKLRVEPRFIYKTLIVLESNQVEWQGSSIDFSVSGLQAQLQESTEFCVGDVVYITFPNLQKITSSHNLKKVPYEVVKINKKKTIINFRVYIKAHQHVGRSFFKLLIDKNKDKLTADEYSLLVPGLAESLRTHYAQSMQIPALIVQKSGSRYKVEALVTNDHDNEFLQKLHRLSDRKNYYNFYPLLTKLYKDNFLDSCLKKLILNPNPITGILYIAIAENAEQVNKGVTIKLDYELDTKELREKFIRKALANGDFYSFQLKISRTNSPDLEYLNAELSYVSTYAIHRSKQIEQDILSVVASIQYIDITHEVLNSHKM